MTFPGTPLDIRTELQIDGSWVVVSGDVYNRDPVTITRGRKSEGSRTDPGSLTLTLNNRDGKYSPRNPLSPYFGKIGRNTPIRVSVPAEDSSFLELYDNHEGYVSTPDTASLDLTGDMDIRAELDIDWYEPQSRTIIGKWDAPAAQRSFHMRVGDGRLRVHHAGPSNTFVTWTFTLPQGLPNRAAVRFTYRADNGSGGRTGTAYWATSLDGPWTMISTGTAAGFFTINNSTAPLQIGITDLVGSATDPRYPFVGRAYRLQLRSAIDGPIVAAPDFRNLADGTTSFTDSAGKVWTVNGNAQIRRRADRFVGEVSSWPTRWDVSGSDVFTPLQASGILRRLGQGQKALDSTLRRRVPSYSPLAYWPMEEGATATQAYSPIDGVAPLATTNIVYGQLDSLASSGPLPVLDFSAGSPTLRGTVPAPGGPITGWQVRWIYRLDQGPAVRRTHLIIGGTGTVRNWQILQSETDGSEIRGTDADGTLIVNHIIGTGPDLYGQWVMVNLRAEQQGSNVWWRVDWQDVGGDAGGFGTTFAGTLGRVTSVSSPTNGYAPDLDGMSIGHIGVFGTTTTVAYDNAITAWAGETATQRMTRLAHEEDVPLRIIGDTTLTSPVGPQTQDTILDLIADAAAADGGLLTEDQTSLGLVYRSRTDLYSQDPALELDFLGPGEVPPPFEPVDDDAEIRNDVTVVRRDGSSARVVLESGPLSVQPFPDGVGRYDESTTLNLYEDGQAANVAGWRLHLGTWDEARYPQISIDLAAAPHKIPEALSLKLGDKLTVSNPPAWLPPDQISQLVQGYTETLTLTTWRLELNCTPAGPWDVAALDSSPLARADTAGAELASSATATATSLSVTTTAGPRWIDSAAYPTQFPFDIKVGGEVVTVTAITGTTSPQTFTVTRSVNGISKSHAAGTSLRLATPTFIAL